MTITTRPTAELSTATHTAQQAYDERLHTLSEASVHQHFDAFLDIDWDEPELAVDPTDPRWVLPEVDILGRTEWYRSLPREEQIRVGIYRQANVAKVGLQFEQVLISGIMFNNLNTRNNNPEFRYSTHEATEECHHTQMFQEFVNRTGQDVPGGPLHFRIMAPLYSFAAAVVPAAFFVGVLAGEEPIDHMQKSILRAGDEVHPLFQRIMQIHVAEEARHIGFAHTYLEHHVPKIGRIGRFFLSIGFPLIMRDLCDVIMVPSKQAQKDMGIPKSVIKDAYWRSPESRKLLRDLFADVRMLATDTGLMNPVSRFLWRLCKIDGRASRFRSEPASAAS